MNHLSSRRRTTRRGLSIALVIGMAAALLSSAPASGVAGFGDVHQGEFFTSAVQWMVDEDITNGTSAGCFSPYDAVTRGQAAAFMWRMEGEPDPRGAHGFVDVVADWQQQPVAWMVEEGITNGTSPGRFSPDSILTRGQTAALLHRLDGSPSASNHGFVDVVAGWQQEPVAWMVDEEITYGTSPGRFSPAAPVTRGQIATFFHRYQGEPTVAVDSASPSCGSTGGGGGSGGGGGGGGTTSTACSGAAVPSPSFSRTFYVDRDHPSASNGNSGSESSPWKTIVHAAAVAQPGDRILVKAGVYDNGEIEIERSGVTISAYPGDEHQAIVRNAGIVSHGNSDLTINGLKFEHAPEHAIRMVGPDAGNVVVSNNHMYDVYKSGISIRGVTGNADPGNYDNMRDVLVVGNLVELANNGGGGEIISVGSGVINAEVANNEVRIGSNEGGGNEGISFKEGVRESRICGNVIHDLTDKGIIIDGGSSSHDPLVTDIEIFDNLVYDIPSQGMWVTTEGRGDVDGVHIHHNTFYTIQGNGILVYEHPGGESAGGTVRNVTIEHNTVWHTGLEGSGRGGIRIDHPSVTGVVIRDNLAWNNGGSYDIRVDPDPGTGAVTIDHNLCGEPICEVRSAPSFVDVAARDFRLSSSSPALGAGSDGSNLGAY